MNATWQRWLERDHALTARATTLIRGPVVRIIATLLAHSGDSLVWLFAGVLLWRFGIGAWAKAGERIVLVTALTWVVSTVLKSFFQRPRPEGDQGLFYLNLDQHSLPSGHATRAGGLVVVLAGVLPLWGTLGLIAWGFLVCLSRVALGLHYAGDMIVGLIAGMGTGALLLVIL